MTKPLALYALFAAVTVGAAPPASAQSTPEGWSCGGLLCDMGMFGHKAAPAPNGDVALAPAGAAAEAAPAAVSEPEASKPAVPERVVTAPKQRTAVRKTRRIAKPAVAPAVADAAARRPTAAARRPTAVASKPAAAEPIPSSGLPLPDPLARPQSPKFSFQPIY